MVERKHSFYLHEDAGQQTPYFYTEMLCIAIIKQAADDYRCMYRRKDRRGVDSLKKFFNSNWFEYLTAEKVSGNYIVTRLNKECSEKYGFKM